MGRIRQNFFYNLILTFSSYVVSFIVFPYVARVLGASNVGRVGFAENIVTYATLFATLGLPVFGVREIASCGQDLEKRDRVFSSILILVSIQTLFVVVLYSVAMFCVPRFSECRDLLSVGLCSVIFASFSLEWFFQGIENFRYVAIRTLAIKVLYAVAVFFFVREKTDTLLYYSLTVVSIILNTIVNIFYSRHFVHFGFSRNSIGRFVKPFYSLGVYRIMVSLYTTFNIVFLGFVCPDTETGFYYTSLKIYAVLNGILNAYTTVMLPRMSSLVSESKLDEFKAGIRRSVLLILAMSLPAAISCAVFAPQIIRIIAGAGYEGAILPMRIIMPVLVISGMAQIWVIQILMPLKSDNVILFGSVLGAVVGISSNFLFTAKLGATGSAVSLLASEFCSNTFCFAYILKNRNIFFTTGRCV